jgi:DNA-binding winged helix-turn-helix (wHTH) protein/Flp pilus assembly protein TadD
MSQLNNIRVYEFDGFRLDPAERLLVRDGQPVSLTPKAFDLLVHLVERHGRLVEKRGVLEALWPDSIVEEANLAYNISALRRVLDNGTGRDSLIQTVPTRGYRFVAAVRTSTPLPPVSAADAAAVIDAGEEAADDAERSLLKARFLIDARLEHWVEESFGLLQQALNIAPTLAVAHVAMSQWFVYAAVRGHVPYDEGFFQATRHAQEAVRLAPGSAEAAGALGRAYYMRRFFHHAERKFQQAIELDASASMVLGSYSELLGILGRHSEALQLVDTALSRQPVSGLLQEAKACVLFTARDFKRCVEWCDDVRAMTPTSSELEYFRGTSFIMLGRYEQALSALYSALTHEPNLASVKVAIAIALHQTGQYDDCGKVIEELNGHNTDAAILAECYAGTGQSDRALDALETGFRRDSPQMMGIAVNPLLDQVRPHSRFRRLLSAMQLDSSQNDTSRILR